MSQRRSDKSGPRVDEARDRETRSIVRGAPLEARAEEAREQEGPAEGEPRAGGRPPVPASSGGEPAGEDVLDRSELARFLEPSAFPSGPGGLLDAARRQHAPTGLLDQLERLPDRRYHTVQQVWEAAADPARGPRR